MKIERGVVTTIYTTKYGQKFLSEEECRKAEKNATAQDKMKWLREELARTGLEIQRLKGEVTNGLRSLGAYRAQFQIDIDNRKQRNDPGFFKFQLKADVDGIGNTLSFVQSRRKQLREARDRKFNLRRKLEDLRESQRPEED